MNPSMAWGGCAATYIQGKLQLVLCRAARATSVYAPELFSYSTLNYYLHKCKKLQQMTEVNPPRIQKKPNFQQREVKQSIVLSEIMNTVIGNLSFLHSPNSAVLHWPMHGTKLHKDFLHRSM